MSMAKSVHPAYWLLNYGGRILQRKPTFCRLRRKVTNRARHLSQPHPLH